MNKSKIFMSVSIAILIVIIIASAVTYAWYEWSTSSENETKIVTNMGAAKVFFDAGTSITGVKLKPTADKANGIVKNITVKTNKDTAYKISFNLYLDVISIDNGLKHETFKYALYKEGETDAVASGNFLNTNLELCETNSTNHIVLIRDETITTTIQEYKLYIWIDGTVDNPSTMENQNFNFKLHADGQNAVLGETLVQHINNLYTPNDTAENNGITYNLDTTHFLMNDRLGTESVGIDNGNIRYYGANPNNYIDIGDTELNEEGEEVPTLYRIIGLFKNVELADGTKKDLVKLIRNDTIGRYSWDQSSEDVNEGYGINEWSQADLMKLLNPNHQNEEVGGSLYWNSGSGNCYGYDSASSTYTSIPCDFTNKGLSTNARTKIETVKWNTGGWNTNGVYPNQIYEYERGNNLVVPGTTCSGSWCNDKVERMPVWPGKVALAYPSDYGYAVDLDSYDTTLNNYSNCTGTNWMYPGITAGGNLASWFLTPYSSFAGSVWFVGYVGSVNGNSVGFDYGVSPVFYLDSALGIVTGDGGVDTPFVVR